MVKLVLYLLVKLLRELKMMLPLGSVTLIDALLTFTLSMIVADISIVELMPNIVPLLGAKFVTFGARLSRITKVPVRVWFLLSVVSFASILKV